MYLPCDRVVEVSSNGRLCNAGREGKPVLPVVPGLLAPLPDDGLPVITRSVVRLVVLDTQDKICSSTPATWVTPIWAPGGSCPAAA